MRQEAKLNDSLGTNRVHRPRLIILKRRVRLSKRNHPILLLKNLELTNEALMSQRVNWNQQVVLILKENSFTSSKPKDKEERVCLFYPIIMLEQLPLQVTQLVAVFR